MHAAVLVVIGLSMIGSARADDMVDAPRKPIQLGPQELRVALPTLGEIEGLHLVFLSEDVENRNTSGVSGNLTYAEALGQLLRGTELTYQFLEARTVMILPATGKGVGASANTGVAQVTITAARPSDAQQLEYFRLLAGMSRSDYKRFVTTLSFVDAGTVSFPGGKGPQHRLSLGQHIQSAGIDGLVLWRALNLTPTKAQSELQVHNGNSFPVFVEIDFEKTPLGQGAYAALAPGETAIWTWSPRLCGAGGVHVDSIGQLSHGSLSALTDWDCSDYVIEPGTAHVRVLKEWEPGSAH